ncbi:LCP family protein [Actinokineospora soli]|uniref:LCP family protein n=1 Tax=Actinokineospora soli TaxID=1048753 RepID=A0ABW2TRV9_9PSEU
MNVVVLGVDEHRADTVMLLRLDGGRVSALSLPRDTWVTVPGRGESRLNRTYEQYGPDVLVDVVADLTGQRVDHWAAVDMAGFERLATAVGGVEVCLRAATSDRFAGADFPAGRQTITGAAALAFVRQRHGLPNGDLDRVVRQQVFVRGLVDKLVTTVLTDPVREAELSELVRSVVRTDPGWSPVALAAQATGPVRAATIPIADAEFQTEAGFALKVEPAEVRRFAAGFFTPEPGGSTPSPGSGGDGCVN